MPFNTNGEYEPTEELRTNVKRLISKYLYSTTDSCSEKEYEKILDLLLGIEEQFFEQERLFINQQYLCFEEQRDRRIQKMKQFAFPKIVEKLEQLKNAQNSDEDDGWTKYESKANKIADKIWTVWSKERERRPRAGVILFYISPEGSFEILLTTYMKNGDIQYGFPKGKIEFWETILNCAARETAEEIGLSFDWIYDRIEGSRVIKKNLFNVADRSTIEHYYYLIRVDNKELPFKPNRQEIEGVEWHDIFTVKCCASCLGKQLVEPTIQLERSNYFMVNCTSPGRGRSLIQNILIDVDTLNPGLNASDKYKQIHRLCRYK